MMKRITNFKRLICIIILCPAFCFGSGLETKGIGARARGMGFAMVSIPDDWSSIHYNPANIGMLAQNTFGSEYEFFTGGLESTESLRNLPSDLANPWKGDFIDFIGDEPASFNKNKISSDIHFGAFGFIFKKDNFSYGFGIYGSGSGTEWSDSISSTIGDTIDAKVSFINASLNIPFAFAYRISDKVSAGISLGVHWGLLTVENKKQRTGYIPYLSKTVQDTQGTSLSYDIGCLWKLTDKLNFGAVLKLPYTFRKSGTTETQFSLMQLNAESDTTIDMRYPLRLAFGISYDFLENQLIAFNINWHNWDKYNLKINYDNEIPSVFQDSSGNPSGWENTFVYNLGYENRLSEKWTARCGITFDQAPEPKESRILTGGQVIDAWLFSFGAGINLGKTVIDFGYIYTYGPEVEGFIPGAKYSLNLHELFIGIVKKF
jgi:long-subunit fatty acid transport protein